MVPVFFHIPGLKPQSSVLQNTSHEILVQQEVTWVQNNSDFMMKYILEKLQTIFPHFRVRKHASSISHVIFRKLFSIHTCHRLEELVFCRGRTGEFEFRAISDSCLITTHLSLSLIDSSFAIRYCGRSCPFNTLL